MDASKNNARRKTQKLSNLSLNAVYAIEKHPPFDEEPMNWILLTNININNFEEAVEKIQWYCLRWRIKVFHKILKSVLKVEECRLQTADRLIRFLTIFHFLLDTGQLQQDLRLLFCLGSQVLA